jgi:hypothetical protein
MAQITKTHIVIPDTHAHPNFSNERAHWIGRLIHDVRPDVVIHIGDSADMPSLASYDKGTRAAVGRTYRADINSHLDFQDRMWWEVKKHKKRMPRSVFCVGNHEQRILKAINVQPELDGTISMSDLELEQFYDEVAYYQGGTPGVSEVDGISYAHYHTAGVMGRPVGGEHPAYSLITKQLTSCTQGHTHVLDYCVRTNANGKRLHGLVCGVAQDYDSPWAGEVNKLWWRGVVIKRNVEEGDYDAEFVSLERLRREYAE